MQILVTPSDIIKRCLWMNFKKFCLNDKTEEEIRLIVNENKPFVISENDAFVVGLLKIVETENIIHRYVLDVKEQLNIKSTIEEVVIVNMKNKVVLNEDGSNKTKKCVLFNKNVLLKDTINYKNNFPDFYETDKTFMDSIKKLNEFLDKIVDVYDKLEVISITKNINNTEKVFDYVYSNSVKKLIESY